MKHFLFFGYLIISFATVTLAQENELKFPLKDSIRLFTDRSVYVTGEEIHFSAFTITGNNNQTEGISKILYTELVTPDGTRLASGKFLEFQGIFSGIISIPQEIVTGLYYIKAYTKYLRNFGPAAYTFKALKIVNPQKPEILSSGKESAGEMTSRTIESSQNSVLPLDIEIRDSVLHRRDSVKVVITAGKDLKGKNPLLCLAVVPTATVGLNEDVVKPFQLSGKSKIHFSPETRGLTLSGNVKDKATGKAIPFDKVHLSIMGSIKDYMAVLTDSTGRFYFPLPPLEGKHDLFIFAENKEGREVTILVDNDYCTEHFDLPSLPFKWKPNEENEAYKIAVNQQVHDAFFTGKEEVYKPVIEDTVPFYGSPSRIINLDKYVQLPSIEEYINEFLPEIRIRKINGKKTFYVFGAQSELNVYPPLVLIDQIAVPDAEKILAISPEKIARIEILNLPYIKGDMIYGGIISFISKKRDFAGIDLTSSGLFLRFSFLEPPSYQFANQSEQADHLPDARTTLFWYPFLPLKSGKSVETWIHLGDTPGTYSIICQGITPEGGYISGIRTIRITQ